ncbi:erythromycin biosynthesis sensory transduction protein eryC1 [Arthrobacter sp. MYb227]|uniref:DegT/DnrJ/EryC1/StrS family aminotransferase n=1 Tax=Arthrobacter sp. MYb227 TaxID=1848601 RepID=UPI000CFDF426|nr:DegT/DnrJ/EryC1/StrS family aminotransferase [Arthrobacter sp. MYb227]PQZ91082.1 erythromycin biosynthesis sensory transduction protein eryC1 [Arthrobacter sp. MYb227]
MKTETSMLNIPLVDLRAQQEEISAEVTSGLAEVFATTSFIGGAPVTEFESSYAEFLGAKHCIGTSNGTDALELALRAADIHAGDEVILPANTFIATAEAVCRIGAIPVLVDVDPQYLLIDPQAVERAVTKKTRAIMPVHLYGQSAFIEQLEPLAAVHELAIIEDAAQSQGATRHGRAAGTIGVAAGTSFYPGKNLGAAGDAGAVITNDPALAERARILGAHGSSTKYEHDVVGFNARMDTLQAVVLNAKLKRLAGWNAKRRQAADLYGQLLAELPDVVVPQSAPGNEDVWHLYVIQVPTRDRVLRALNQAGIGAGIHYPYPLHLTKAFASLGQQTGSFPVAEQAATRILSLPLHPHITAEEQHRVIEQLRKILGSDSTSSMWADT